jgi:hypothetical protein
MLTGVGCLGPFEEVYTLQRDRSLVGELVMAHGGGLWGLIRGSCGCSVEGGVVAH